MNGGRVGMGEDGQVQSHPTLGRDDLLLGVKLHGAKSLTQGDTKETVKRQNAGY